MTSSLKIQKREYLWDEGGYSGKENAILLCSEKPFKSAAIIFYFIGTLNIVAENSWGAQILQFLGVFNKTIIPIALVATHLVGYLPSHIQRALVE